MLPWWEEERGGGHSSGGSLALVQRVLPVHHTSHVTRHTSHVTDQTHLASHSSSSTNKGAQLALELVREDAVDAKVHRTG